TIYFFQRDKTTPTPYKIRGTWPIEIAIVQLIHVDPLLVYDTIMFMAINNSNLMITINLIMSCFNKLEGNMVNYRMCYNVYDNKGLYEVANKPKLESLVCKLILVGPLIQLLISLHLYLFVLLKFDEHFSLLVLHTMGIKN
ncbi:hypothetical protein ACJX0J_012858, partial [Zea mays]